MINLTTEEINLLLKSLNIMRQALVISECESEEIAKIENLTENLAVEKHKKLRLLHD